MPNFEPLFIESQGKSVHYKGKSIVRIDKFPVENGDVLIASIEKTDSNKRQGFYIDITGHCEMDGEVHKSGKGVMMLFWEDTAPQTIKLKVFTKKGFVWIQNMWEEKNRYLIASPEGVNVEKENESINYGVNGAAMIVEEIENGRRYRCNDGEPDDDFNDIIFTVQKE